ncbi:MAG TPA: maleylpyruvate isomerase family mycothiol-dependent enzyme [Actinobacteria bacterium]|nr:maleylpyruvate isomerase family mycothiol-dependent enzyme [Actinomycetota bacterium]
MREILSDLVAEEQHLDQFLQTLSERDWQRPTPAAGWSILDQVNHLAAVEALAAEVIAEGAERLAREEVADVDAWTARHVAEGRGLRHQAVIERWRHARAEVVDALSRLDASTRIPWLYGDMSARSFATMRLMETWAHGLDIKAAILGRVTPLAEEELGEDEEDPLADTDRLRHVAWLAHASLPFAFREAGERFPESGIRVEVMGPRYQAWRFGPEDTEQVIRGKAGEFCRVAVHRQTVEETTLKAIGEDAEVALRVLRCY